MPLSTLNREQLSAVTAPMGNNLVIASAGTGKHLQLLEELQIYF